MLSQTANQFTETVDIEPGRLLLYLGTSHIEKTLSLHELQLFVRLNLIESPNTYYSGNVLRTLSPTFMNLIDLMWKTRIIINLLPGKRPSCLLGFPIISWGSSNWSCALRMYRRIHLDCLLRSIWFKRWSQSVLYFPSCANMK